MPGGKSANSQQTKDKDKVKTGNTVQTLLAAKVDKDKDKPKAPKTYKRTHSEVSNESNTSLDLTGLINIQKDLDEIKHNLEGVVTKRDLDNATKDLVKVNDVEKIVTVIVKNLMKEFEMSMEKKMEEKINEVKQEMQEKIDSLSIENESLIQRTEYLKSTVQVIKKDLNENINLTKDTIISSNYNEQYSRKTNIKVLNFPQKERQNLRADFIDVVKTNLNVKLEDRDVVAIHRLPSNNPGPKPLIVKFFSTDVKRHVMREKKKLQNNVRFYDDITKRNLNLMTKLRNTNRFASVWYYNCSVYGCTEDNLQLKFGLYDDIFLRLRQRK